MNTFDQQSRFDRAAFTQNFCGHNSGAPLVACFIKWLSNPDYKNIFKSG